MVWGLYPSVGSVILLTTTPHPQVFKIFIPAAVGRLRLFLMKKGTHVSVAACRALHPELQTFDMWARAQGLDKRVFEAPRSCSIA